MCSIIYKSRFFLFFVLCVSILAIPVNHIEASPAAVTGLEYQVCQDFDIVYVLDLSGSMNWGYGGAGSRLDAAKDAIVQMNNVLEEDGAGVEAALLTWQGLSTNLAVNFTNDFNSISTVVNGLSAGGGTPTAQALYGTKDVLLANSDPNRIPIVLFITDGIPTYDLDGNGYYDYYVNAVPIVNPYGGFYSSNWVRNQGVYYGQYGRHAGYPLADAMVAVDDLSSSLSDLTIHSISILGTDFRQDLLQYAAHQGGGEYFGASNANQLAAAIQQAVYSVECPSSLQITADHTSTFTLGGVAQTVDPNVTVTGENEGVSSATVQLTDHFDASKDTLYIGDTPADSGVFNGLSWWYEQATGNLEIVGVGTPSDYQTILRQVRYTNSAMSDNETDMSTRRVNFAIRSASLNVYDPGTLNDDAFVNLAFLTGTDFGDAASSFGSAGQAADMFLRLGDTVDVEPAAQFSNAANGDDLNQSDDEDGITFVGGNTIYRGGIGTVEVRVNNRRQDGAIVEGWIDFNLDGQFDETTERLAGFGLTFNQQANTQTQVDAFAVPGDSVCGFTTARFRLTTASGGASADSNGIGETEDYPIEISCDTVELPDDFDYGDGAASYGDAMHRILPGMGLGQSVDAEPLALSSTDANGDDITDSDDEDGIIFPNGATGILDQTVDIHILARNSVHLDAFVSGWVDWNQDGIFDEATETIIDNELVPLSADDVLLKKQLIVPTDAACDNTTIRVRIASEPVGPNDYANTGEAEDILFFVDCTVELGVKVTPSLSEVALEETLDLLAEVDNTGPNFARDAVVTLTLPVGLDVKSLTPHGSWACQLQDNDTKVYCTTPILPITDFISVFTVSARVPGIYLQDSVAGTAVVSSAFPEKVGEEADNTADYDVPVVKEWTGEGVPMSNMIPFSHVVFDNVLQFSDETEADFEIDDLIVNPFQVPMTILPGLELPTAPQLIAFFCATHNTAECTTPDAILTGTIRLNSYTVDTFMAQEIDDSTGEPLDAAWATNQIDTNKTIQFGATGAGRILEADLDKCLDWVGQLNGGNCMTRYDQYKTFDDNAQYVWSSDEYIELILQSPGGDPIECSGAAGDCIQLLSARPGVYRLGGTIQGDMVFNDPEYDRLGTGEPILIDFEYPFNIYIQIVGAFAEPDRND